MLSTLNTTQKGILYALIGFSAFVVSDSCAKWLSTDYEVLQIVGWIYLFALLFGVVFSRSMGGFSNTLKTPKLNIHLWRGLCNFGLAISVVTAFQNMPLTSVYPVLFLAPFIITIFAIPFYKEHVPPMNWVIIATGFGGVVIAFQPWTNPISIWVLVAFFTTLCIAGLSLLARPLDEKETLLSLSFYPSLVNVALIFPVILYLYGIPNILDFPIFMLAGVMLVCGMSGVASACRITRYAIIAPLHYSQLILVFTIGFFIFGERPDWWMIGGSIIIALSGLMLALSDKKPIVVEH
ncbi:MAG: DMT family transporter [Alphaproteobacteria bacterium]